MGKKFELHLPWHIGNCIKAFWVEMKPYYDTLERVMARIVATHNREIITQCTLNRKAYYKESYSIKL